MSILIKFVSLFVMYMYMYVYACVCVMVCAIWVLLILACKHGKCIYDWYIMYTLGLNSIWIVNVLEERILRNLKQDHTQWRIYGGGGV